MTLSFQKPMRALLSNDRSPTNYRYFGFVIRNLVGVGIRLSFLRSIIAVRLLGPISLASRSSNRNLPSDVSFRAQWPEKRPACCRMNCAVVHQWIVNVSIPFESDPLEKLFESSTV